MTKTSVVITSIYEANAVVKKIAEGCLKNNWSFVIAGDTLSTPVDQEGVTFLGVADQLSMGSRYAKRAPFRNYCRKNLGYLHSIRSGADRIIETDDDNFPMDTFFQPFDRYVDTKAVIQKGWVNAYRYFTDNENIWPRGFSLSDVKRPIDTYLDLKEKKLYCPVQNGLVDNDPDIDALYRILFAIPFNFEHKDRKVAYYKGSWCSFNTQNTVVYKIFGFVTPLEFQLNDAWFADLV